MYVNENENDFLSGTSTNLKDDSLNTPVAKQKFKVQVQAEETKKIDQVPTSDDAAEPLDETITQNVPTSSPSSENLNEKGKTKALGTPTPPTTPKTEQSVTEAATVLSAAAAAVVAEAAPATAAEPPPKQTATVSAPVITKLDVNSPSKSPILLNRKILLSKSSATPQTIVKIATTSKSISSPSTATTTTTTTITPTTTMATPTKTTATTVGTVTTVDGKTTLKTASGQIVYIQKGQTKNTIITAGSAPTTLRIKSATPIQGAATTKNLSSVKVAPVSSTAVASSSNNKLLTTTAATANIGGNKTVIQLIRSADGKLLPLKTATSGGNSTLAFSPNIAAQLAGKKIFTATGGQVVLKTPLKAATPMGATNVTAAAAESVVCTAKPIKIQKIIPPPSGSALVTSTTTSTSSSSSSISTGICQSSIVAPKSNVVTATLPSSNAATAAKTTASESISVSTTAKITTAATTVAPATTTSSGSSGTITTAGGKIVVQGTQIVVPSSQIIKLSPKLGGTVATTPTVGGVSGGNTSTTNSSAPISGALHAIHIPGKPGLQYVRVFTAPKKPLPPPSSAATTPVVSTTASTSATAMVQTTASAKMVNTVPPKFTVVRPSPTGKLILTKSPKGDGNSVLPPISANKIKTIVTMPTIRKIYSSMDTPSPNTSPLATSVSILKTAPAPASIASANETSTSSSASNLSDATMTTIGMVRPKPKISEINSEIQRMTGSSTIGDGKRYVSGPDGKRYLVMPRSMLRTNTQNHAIIGQQNQLNQQQNQQKQQPQQQQNSQQPKLFSVLKATSNAAITGGSSSEGGMKSFIICKSAQGGNTMKAIQVKRPAQQISQLEADDEDPPRKLPTLKTIATPTSIATETVTTERKLLSPTNAAQQSLSNNKFVPIKIKQEPVDNNDDMNSLMFSADGMVRGGVRRKHCNCSKSQCLKLYCDCFANGEFCQDCTCKDCFNNLQYEDERQRAIKSCLERNPSAFKPKITTSTDQSDTRLHNKGCNCKRSGCLKNYCECFEAKIPCSSNCKCVGCRNVEDRPDLDLDPIDPKLLESIANASNATNNIARAVNTSKVSFASGIRRTYDRAFVKREFKSESDYLDDNDQQRLTNRKRSHLDDEITGTAALFASPQLTEAVDADGNVVADKRSSNFITQEVIDATIQCMISQADECLKNNLPAIQIEKMVLEELGRCLVEIIDFSIRNTDTSFSQN